MSPAGPLLFAILVFIVFLVLCHYGIHMTLWASITISSLIGLIVLNMIYTPYELIQAEASPELCLFTIVVLAGIINAFVFAFAKGLCSRRMPKPCD
jgi:asparagine N-glycosylation enzyme membrane subunit Stt3